MAGRRFTRVFIRTSASEVMPYASRGDSVLSVAAMPVWDFDGLFFGVCISLVDESLRLDESSHFTRTLVLRLLGLWNFVTSSACLFMGLAVAVEGVGM